MLSPPLGPNALYRVHGRTTSKPYLLVMLVDSPVARHPSSDVHVDPDDRKIVEYAVAHVLAVHLHPFCHCWHDCVSTVRMILTCTVHVLHDAVSVEVLG